MTARGRTPNVVILGLFVAAVLAAGAAIFYFGGGTEPFPRAVDAEVLDPSVGETARDGLSPGLSLSQQADKDGSVPADPDP